MKRIKTDVNKFMKNLKNKKAKFSKSGLKVSLHKSKGAPPKPPVGSAVIGRLIELKIQLDSMKPLYAQYDKLLDVALRSGKIPDQARHRGQLWTIAVIDAFEQKNTAWKSVAQRRYDVAISRARKPDSDDAYKVFKVKRN